MKRNRNTFFTNYQAQTESFIPPMSNQPFYNSSMNYNQYSGPSIENYNEIDNRLSKIERQINRLDNRLSKLESSTIQKLEQQDSNYSNMYML